MRMMAQRTSAPREPPGRRPRASARPPFLGNQARLRRMPAKLTIGAVNHPLEHEADAVSKIVMRTPDSALSVSAAPLQASRKCAACEEEEKLQARRAGTAAVEGEAPAAVHDVLRSPGRPLDAEARAFFEPRFGADFSRVRVHDDIKAAQSTREVGARAYAVGDHIAFARNQHAPREVTERGLIAHELVHVMQQSGEPRLRRDGDPSQTPQPDPNNPASSSSAPGGGAASAGGGAAGAKVFICAKDLETSPIGRHAFFRVGGPASANPTYELEPQDNRPVSFVDGDSHHSGCWQGVPMQDVAEDKSYVANVSDCQETAISLSCLQQQFASYPIGQYCTFGPNSNTFVGHIAKQCGLANPDPAGWTPGIDDSPPASGTFAPSPKTTIVGCTKETGCGVVAPPDKQKPTPGGADGEPA